jgi:hypothetical protein
VIGIDPVLRLVLQLTGFGAIPAWMLARAAVRWWSTSLTVVVARARLSAWGAAVGRFLRAKLPAANPPELGGRVLPTVGSVSSTADPTVAHPRRAA